MKKPAKSFKDSNYKLTQQITAKKNAVKKRDPFKERGVKDHLDFLTPN
ncbi:MAG: hypothetical protein IPI04_14085 [Ignavibacteria bacterium]|nr:hypothetical protein [Ignavibacteria bacterium]